MSRGFSITYHSLVSLVDAFSTLELFLDAYVKKISRPVNHFSLLDSATIAMGSLSIIRLFGISSVLGPPVLHYITVTHPYGIYVYHAVEIRT